MTRNDTTERHIPGPYAYLSNDTGAPVVTVRPVASAWLTADCMIPDGRGGEVGPYRCDAFRVFATRTEAEKATVTATGKRREFEASWSLEDWAARGYPA